MASQLDPLTGTMDDDEPEPGADGLAGQQEKDDAETPGLGAPPPPAPPVTEPEPSTPAPTTQAPATALPGSPGPNGASGGDLNDIPPDVQAPGGPGGQPPDANAAFLDSIAGPKPGAPAGEEWPPPVPTGAGGAPGDVKPIVPATTQAELTQQQIDERQGKSDSDKAEAQAKATAAKDVLDAKIEAQKQRAAIVKQGEDDLAAARAQHTAEYEKYRAMGEKDVWGDHGTRNRILAGIALLIGGRKAAYGIIGAVEGLEAKKKEEVAFQAKMMEKSGKDADDVRSETAQKLANLNLQTAAGLDATAARADSELAAMGVPAAQRAANKDILQIQQEALNRRRQADIDAHKNAEQQIKDDLAKQKIESETKLNNAKVEELGKRTHKPYGTGGGGTGAKSAKQVMAERKAQQGDERLLNQDVSQFRKESGYDAFSKQADTAISVADRLKNPNINGAEAAGLLMALDQAHRGGAATAVSVDQVMGHLGGATDKMIAWLQKNKDGKLPEQYVNTLRDVASNLEKDRRAQIAKAHDEFVQRFYVEDPKFKDDPFLHDKVSARSAAMFGRYGYQTDKQRAAEAAKPPAEATGTNAGQSSAAKAAAPAPTLKINPASKTDKALEVRARATKPGDPNYDSAQTWLHAHGLQ